MSNGSTALPAPLDSWTGPAPSSRRRSVASWWRHPRTVDVAIAVVAAVVWVLMDAFGPDGRSGHALVWDVVLALPLLARRSQPALTAAVIAALCLVQWAADVPAGGDFAVLIALYTLGAYERRRWVLATAVVVAQLGAFLAVTRWAPSNERLLSMITATGTITASWVLGIYVRTRRAFVATMRDRAETAERERDNLARIAVADERARIARELHDVIAHSLSVMITLNDAAAAVSPADQDLTRQTIGQASDVGRQALTEMHRMLGVLRGDEAAGRTPQPDATQLAQLVSVVRSAGLDVELAVSGDLLSLPTTLQVSLYRVVQESLTNVLKHADNVERVVVDVRRGTDRVDVRIVNDGTASHPARETEPGHGIDGMTERAALFGGRVVAGPTPGGGWQVSASFQLDAAAARR